MAGGGGGARVVVGGGGGGAAGLAAGGGGGADGFRDTGGGGARPTPGGGGGARGGGLSGALAEEIVEDGLAPGRGGTFFKLATNGFIGGAGSDSVDGGGGGREPGSLGAPGGFGGAEEGAGRDASESDRYGESDRLAPVLTPPRLRSLGIPPAKRPPNCGAAALTAASEPDTPSLLLRNLLAAGPDGTGGASPVGGGLIPGTGGAAPIGGAAELPPVFPITGADRSLVVAFFSLVPL